MCGICGVFAPSRQHLDSTNLVRRMCDQMIHRGPNGEGFFSEGPIALGMRRLSIIDLDGGSQPIFNEDKSVCVIQNGEIYNYRVLRQDLENKGHLFSTQSDTEVIVHLYEEYGEEFVKHLNGMFAIAIWDSTRHRLVIARDRLGQKPLYYCSGQDSFVFASEIKCLLQDSNIDTAMDPQAVLNYFTLGYINQPRSIYQSIRKLPPGCLLTIDENATHIHSYWEPQTEINRNLSFVDATELLIEIISDAVKIRMMSEVPLGAFLSGGIDSSIIVAMMAEYSEKPVKTFFIDFDDDRYSEREYARDVANRYGTEHHELKVRAEAVDLLDNLVDCFDEPFADSSALPTYLVSKLTREHVTVALAGDGGDESFGGYRRYQQILSRREVPSLRRIVSPFARASQFLPKEVPGKRFLRSLSQSNRHYYAIGVTEIESRKLLTREFLDTIDSSVADEVLTSKLRGDFDDPLSPYTSYDQHWFLPDDILTKVDRTSMAHSLEVRAPFLDYRIIDLASTFPSHWKIHKGTTKYILKEAFKEKLPASVLKPRKRGFSIPLADWLRGDLRPLLEETLSSRTLAQSGIFSMKHIQQLADEHLKNIRDRAPQLWRIIFFARWLESRNSS